MSEWISVEDRLPEEGACIAFAPKGKNQIPNIIVQCSVSVFGDFIYGHYNNRLSGVTHWMPMPEPPTDK